MSKEAMKLAIEALEAGEYYIDDLEAIVYAADDLGTHEDRAKMQAAITALRSALAEQPAQQGWKLVPVEPTQAMVDAYLAANLEYWRKTDEIPTPPSKWRTGTPNAATVESYRAMLNAAPQPAQAQLKEPVAQVVCDPDGSNKRVIFHSYKALWETPINTKLCASPPPQRNSEALYAAPETGAFPEDIEAAADELVRLHKANQAMLEALKEIVEMWDAFVPTELTAEPHLKARAAIAKGEQS